MMRVRFPPPAFIDLSAELCSPVGALGSSPSLDSLGTSANVAFDPSGRLDRELTSLTGQLPGLCLDPTDLSPWGQLGVKSSPGQFPGEAVDWCTGLGPDPGAGQGPGALPYSLDRAILLAPVSGTVHTMLINAAGERVKARDEMATIVPSLQLLAAVAVPSRVSAPVRKGSSAKLSVDAFPSNDFGELSGKIVSISPNTSISQEAGKDSNYRAMIAINRSLVPPRFPIDQLRPGMGVKAKVKLRDRAVITLVFDFLDKAIAPLTQRK